VAHPAQLHMPKSGPEKILTAKTLANTQNDRVYARFLKKTRCENGKAAERKTLLLLTEKNNHLCYGRIYITMAKCIITNFLRLILEYTIFKLKY